MRLSPEQLRGVESPATVLLVPMHLGDTATWWSHDQILLGGVCVNSIKEIPDEPHRTLIGHLPTPVPRSWGKKEFRVVVEYEAPEETALFRFRLFYGCGDPSNLHLGQTRLLEGVAGKKQRLAFRLNEEHIARNELFRCSLEVGRLTPDEVLVYGTWLEVGVD